MSAYELGISPQTLKSRSLEAVAAYIKSGKARRVTVLTGAGISTAAGIPDFRSPGTGLYANLARLNLPYAEAVFDISYFRSHPEPFYYLAKELYPGKFHPTVSHAFIALLAKKGLLKMNFTQNIDCLERRAGVPADKIIEAHGSFATQCCIACSAPYPDNLMRKHVEDEVVPRCDKCDGLVKPDIVFFGESLPDSFCSNIYVPSVSDLIIIIGTSLTVYPFAGLPETVPAHVPRLLLNKEPVSQVGSRPDDVVELGSCDAGVRRLADLLGWRDELEGLWRSVVGETEAERQLSGSDDHGESEDDLDEEIRKITEEVGSALNLDGVRNDRDVSPASATEEGHVRRIANILQENNSTKSGTLSGPGRKKDDFSAESDATRELRNLPTDAVELSGDPERRRKTEKPVPATSPAGSPDESSAADAPTGLGTVADKATTSQDDSTSIRTADQPGGGKEDDSKTMLDRANRSE